MKAVLMKLAAKPRAFMSLVAILLVAPVTIIAAHPAYAQLAPFGGPRPVAIGGVTGWILAQQAVFYRMLASLLHAAKENGSAMWGLMGVSFLYGIFHAAGPGHGKAVISSYLFANDETWRRGMALSFISAAMQSVTAIAIVGIAAALLGATAKFMGDTVHVIEIASYSLIVLLGLRLLWVKGHNFVSALRALRAGSTEDISGTTERDPASCGHAVTAGFGQRNGTMHNAALCGCDSTAEMHCHSDHDHHDDELDVLPWGHAHAPEPDELAGPGGWRRGLAAVVAVGLRPCSGAIIVLVFALAQGLFWTGVASTFVMGLGTAITVGTIATLAVGARAVAKRLAQRPAGYGTLIMRGAEFGAAGFVLAFGILLLTGYIASERMGLF